MQPKHSFYCIASFWLLCVVLWQIAVVRFFDMKIYLPFHPQFSPIPADIQQNHNKSKYTHY